MGESLMFGEDDQAWNEVEEAEDDAGAREGADDDIWKVRASWLLNQRRRELKLAASWALGSRVQHRMKNGAAAQSRACPCRRGLSPWRRSCVHG